MRAATGRESEARRLGRFSRPRPPPPRRRRPVCPRTVVAVRRPRRGPRTIAPRTCPARTATARGCRIGATTAMHDGRRRRRARCAFAADTAARWSCRVRARRVVCSCGVDAERRRRCVFSSALCSHASGITAVCSVQYVCKAPGRLLSLGGASLSAAGVSRFDQGSQARLRARRRNAAAPGHPEAERHASQVSQKLHEIKSNEFSRQIAAKGSNHARFSAAPTPN